MADFNGFILYLDQYEPISGLSLEQKGMLLEAMFAFHAGKPYKVADPVVNMAFGFFKAGFEREKRKHTAICNRRKEAANARWGTKASEAMQNMQMHASASDAMQTMPYQDQDQDQDKKNTFPDGNVVGAEPPTPPQDAASRHDSRAPDVPEATEKAASPPCPYEQIRDLYHAAFPEHPRVALLNAKRKTAVKARWSDAGKRLRELKRPDCAAERLAYFQRLFSKAAMSDFLTGKKAFRDGSVYRVDFDKLMSPGGFMGVIEGKYDNRPEA